MGLENAIYALSQINSVLGGTTGYIQDRQNGVPVASAIGNLGYNIMNGAFRNEMSREILNSSGSYLGYAVNNAAGYGNPVANYQGTIGTMQAALLTTPFNIFGCCCNPMMTSNLYGCGPISGGFFNNRIYGATYPVFGGPSCFAASGYWC